MSYKSGTLVTLKDGNVYRTSKEEYPDLVCTLCKRYYIDNVAIRPCDRCDTFGELVWEDRVDHCYNLYGDTKFPKLVFPKRRVIKKY